MKVLLSLSALIALALAGCDAGTPERKPAPPSPEVETPAGPAPLQMAQWSRNCALCHVRGEGGAPVLGDQAAWAERSRQGEDVLLAHTLEGFNNMPPLGYCMDCETADFLALIRFMSDPR